MRYALAILISCIFSSCDKRPNMPSFDILLKDSVTILNTSEIPRGSPVLFFYFSPDCDHCQAETADILTNIDSLKSVRMYFITSDEFSRLKVYNNYYKIDRYPNIVLGRDVKNKLVNHFNIMSPPFSAIYNKNKKLVALFAGEVKASDLLKQLRKVN